MTATPAVADLSGGGDPGAPVNTPVEWTAMAAARRTASQAAAGVAPAASQVTAAAVGDPTYEFGACTQSSTACTYVLSPSGVPIPTATYTQNVMNFYVLPNAQSEQNTAQAVFTPEGAYPVTGIKGLPLTISAEQGKTILVNTIETLEPGPQPGDIPVTIFGFSQSAVISSLLQRDLTDPTMIGLLPGLDRDTTTFVTVGQEMNPNGGWFARFPGLNAASLGEFFFGSTPENAFPTTNYTLEYDGFADSPRYPANILSTLNAAMGILLVHTEYANPNYFAKTYGTVLGSYDPIMGTLGPGYACQNGATSCTRLPTTDADQAYYFIQTPNLPLLAPLRAIPLIGKPLADLVQPFLKVIVNLGYADPAHGFTSATQPMANLPMPFGIFPHVDPKEVIQQLAAAVPQGIHDFFAALGEGGQGSGVTLPSLNQVVAVAKEIISTLPARISAGASALYATVLATADFLNALVVTLPAYDVSLFVEGIKQALNGQVIQGLVNAIGRPIAADIGMIGTISVFQLTVWLEGIAAAITGCGPAAPTTGLCIA
ncbi:MAG: PE-PPE domain-containing protein [Mycobacterium sp.]|nr:PE-PPE domain-containing protein [Mycobacterium sp.]